MGAVEFIVAITFSRIAVNLLEVITVNFYKWSAKKAIIVNILIINRNLTLYDTRNPSALLFH